MQKFTRNLLTEWRRLNLPFADEKVLIAVSGGADSCSLTFALSRLIKRKKLRNQFIIAHFNHGLRGKESEEDAEFVGNFANDLGLDFIVEKAKSNQIPHNKNIEQNARKARYEFLLKTAKSKKSKIILTAHTINDQAETFLINLLRGSGIEGLSAMPQIRDADEASGVLIVRPMLSWAKRNDAEQFCQENQIDFRNDSMNEDLKFTRVKIRKKLIPYLQKYNPKIIETLANTSKLLRKDAEILADSIDAENLKISYLKNLSKPILYRVLRKWLQNERGNLRLLELKHFKAIERLIHSKKSGKTVELPNFEKVFKENGKLNFQKTQVEK